MKLTDFYSYGNKFQNKERIDATSISLPVDKNNKINFKLINSFINDFYE